MNILVLGATGMLGSAVFRILSEADGVQVFGTIRSEAARRFFAPELASRLIFTENLDDKDTLHNLFDFVTPGAVINCVALEKSTLSDPMMSISIFSLLPHRLALL